MVTDPISIVLSILAFVISTISLWKSSLTPFKLKIYHGSPSFALYEILPIISGGKKTWWIPSIDIGLTFQNLGKRSGEITDIRMQGTLRSKDHVKNFNFFAKWIVNFSKFEQNRFDRLQWIDLSVRRDWYPFSMTGEQQSSLHLILEGLRWDDKFEGNLELSLQVYSTENERWVSLENYELPVVKTMYKGNNPYGLGCSKLQKTRRE